MAMWSKACTAIPALVLLLLLAGCAAKDESPAVPMTDSPYYPLKKDMVWDYHVRYEAGVQKARLKVIKLDRIKLDPAGKKLACAQIEMTVDGKKISFEHVRVEEGGVYRLQMAGQKGNQPFQFLKLPPRKGETWTAESKFPAQFTMGEVSATFTAGEEQVTVPAGTYTAITAESQEFTAGSNKATTKTWFAKDVGMVKQVLKVADQEIVFELEKFTPPP